MMNIHSFLLSICAVVIVATTIAFCRAAESDDALFPLVDLTLDSYAASALAPLKSKFGFKQPDDQQDDQIPDQNTDQVFAQPRFRYVLGDPAAAMSVEQAASMNQKINENNDNNNNNNSQTGVPRWACSNFFLPVQTVASFNASDPGAVFGQENGNVYGSVPSLQREAHRNITAVCVSPTLRNEKQPSQQQQQESNGAVFINQRLCFDIIVYNRTGASFMFAPLCTQVAQAAHRQQQNTETPVVSWRVVNIDFQPATSFSHRKQKRQRHQQQQQQPQQQSSKCGINDAMDVFLSATVVTATSSPPSRTQQNGGNSVDESLVSYFTVSAQVRVSETRACSLLSDYTRMKTGNSNNQMMSKNFVISSPLRNASLADHGLPHDDGLTASIFFTSQDNDENNDGDLPRAQSVSAAAALQSQSLFTPYFSASSWLRTTPLDFLTVGSPPAFVKSLSQPMWGTSCFATFHGIPPIGLITMTVIANDISSGMNLKLRAAVAAPSPSSGADESATTTSSAPFIAAPLVVAFTAPGTTILAVSAPVSATTTAASSHSSSLVLFAAVVAEAAVPSSPGSCGTAARPACKAWLVFCIVNLSSTCNSSSSSSHSNSSPASVANETSACVLDAAASTSPPIMTSDPSAITIQTVSPPLDNGAAADDEQSRLTSFVVHVPGSKVVVRTVVPNQAARSIASVFSEGFTRAPLRWDALATTLPLIDHSAFSVFAPWSMDLGNSGADVLSTTLLGIVPDHQQGTAATVAASVIKQQRQQMFSDRIVPPQLFNFEINETSIGAFSQSLPLEQRNNSCAAFAVFQQRKQMTDGAAADTILLEIRRLCDGDSVTAAANRSDASQRCELSLQQPQGKQQQQQPLTLQLATTRKWNGVINHPDSGIRILLVFSTGTAASSASASSVPDEDDELKFLQILYHPVQPLTTASVPSSIVNRTQWPQLGGVQCAILSAKNPPVSTSAPPLLLLLSLPSIFQNQSLARGYRVKEIIGVAPSSASCFDAYALSTQWCSMLLKLRVSQQVNNNNNNGNERNDDEDKFLLQEAVLSPQVGTFEFRHALAPLFNDTRAAGATATATVTTFTAVTSIPRFIFSAYCNSVIASGVSSSSSSALLVISPSLYAADVGIVFVDTGSRPAYTAFFGAPPCINWDLKSTSVCARRTVSSGAGAGGTGPENVHNGSSANVLWSFFLMPGLSGSESMATMTGTVTPLVSGGTRCGTVPVVFNGDNPHFSTILCFSVPDPVTGFVIGSIARFSMKLRAVVGSSDFAAPPALSKAPTVAWFLTAGACMVLMSPHALRIGVSCGALISFTWLELRSEPEYTIDVDLNQQWRSFYIFFGTAGGETDAIPRSNGWRGATRGGHVFYIIIDATSDEYNNGPTVAFSGYAPPPVPIPTPRSTAMQNVTSDPPTIMFSSVCRGDWSQYRRPGLFSEAILMIWNYTYIDNNKSSKLYGQQRQGRRVSLDMISFNYETMSEVPILELKREQKFHQLYPATPYENADEDDEYLLQSGFCDAVTQRIILTAVPRNSAVAWSSSSSSHDVRIFGVAAAQPGIPSANLSAFTLWRYDTATHTSGGNVQQQQQQATSQKQQQQKIKYRPAIAPWYKPTDSSSNFTIPVTKCSSGQANRHHLSLQAYGIALIQDDSCRLVAIDVYSGETLWSLSGMFPSTYFYTPEEMSAATDPAIGRATAGVSEVRAGLFVLMNESAGTFELRRVKDGAVIGKIGFPSDFSGPLYGLAPFRATFGFVFTGNKFISIMQWQLLLDEIFLLAPRELPLMSQATSKVWATTVFSLFQNMLRLPRSWRSYNYVADWDNCSCSALWKVPPPRTSAFESMSQQAQLAQRKNLTLYRTTRPFSNDPEQTWYGPDRQLNYDEFFYDAPLLQLDGATLIEVKSGCYTLDPSVDDSKREPPVRGAELIGNVLDIVMPPGSGRGYFDFTHIAQIVGSASVTLPKLRTLSLANNELLLSRDVSSSDATIRSFDMCRSSFLSEPVMRKLLDQRFVELRNKQQQKPSSSSSSGISDYHFNNLRGAALRSVVPTQLNVSNCGSGISGAVTYQLIRCIMRYDSSNTNLSFVVVGDISKQGVNAVGAGGGGSGGRAAAADGGGLTNAFADSASQTTLTLRTLLTHLVISNTRFGPIAKLLNVNLLRVSPYCIVYGLRNIGFRGFLPITQSIPPNQQDLLQDDTISALEVQQYKAYVASADLFVPLFCAIMDLSHNIGLIGPLPRITWPALEILDVSFTSVTRSYTSALSLSMLFYDAALAGTVVKLRELHVAGCPALAAFVSLSSTEAVALPPLLPSVRVINVSMSTIVGAIDSRMISREYHRYLFPLQKDYPLDLLHPEQPRAPWDTEDGGDSSSSGSSNKTAERILIDFRGANSLAADSSDLFLMCGVPPTELGTERLGLPAKTVVFPTPVEFWMSVNQPGVEAASPFPPLSSFSANGASEEGQSGSSSSSSLFMSARCVSSPVDNPLWYRGWNKSNFGVARLSERVVSYYDTLLFQRFFSVAGANWCSARYKQGMPSQAVADAAAAAAGMTKADVENEPEDVIVIGSMDLLQADLNYSSKELVAGCSQVVGFVTTSEPNSGASSSSSPSSPRSAHQELLACGIPPLWASSHAAEIAPLSSAAIQTMRRCLSPIVERINKRRAKWNALQKQQGQGQSGQLLPLINFTSPLHSMFLGSKQVEENNATLIVITVCVKGEKRWPSIVDGRPACEVDIEFRYEECTMAKRLSRPLSDTAISSSISSTVSEQQQQQSVPLMNASFCFSDFSGGLQHRYRFQLSVPNVSGNSLPIFAKPTLTRITTGPEVINPAGASSGAANGVVSSCESLLPLALFPSGDLFPLKTTFNFLKPCLSSSSSSSSQSQGLFGTGATSSNNINKNNNSWDSLQLESFSFRASDAHFIMQVSQPASGGGGASSSDSAIPQLLRFSNGRCDDAGQFPANLDDIVCPAPKPTPTVSQQLINFATWPSSVLKFIPARALLWRGCGAQKSSRPAGFAVIGPNICTPLSAMFPAVTNLERATFGDFNISRYVSSLAQQQQQQGGASGSPSSTSSTDPDGSVDPMTTTTTTTFLSAADEKAISDELRMVQADSAHFAAASACMQIACSITNSEFASLPVSCDQVAGMLSNVTLCVLGTTPHHPSLVARYVETLYREGGGRNSAVAQCLRRMSSVTTTTSTTSTTSSPSDSAAAGSQCYALPDPGSVAARASAAWLRTVFDLPLSKIGFRVVVAPPPSPPQHTSSATPAASVASGNRVFLQSCTGAFSQEELSVMSLSRFHINSSLSDEMLRAKRTYNNYTYLQRLLDAAINNHSFDIAPGVTVDDVPSLTTLFTVQSDNADCHNGIVFSLSPCRPYLIPGAYSMPVVLLVLASVKDVVMMIVGFTILDRVEIRKVTTRVMARLVVRIYPFTDEEAADFAAKAVSRFDPRRVENESFWECLVRLFDPKLKEAWEAHYSADINEYRQYGKQSVIHHGGKRRRDADLDQQQQQLQQRDGGGDDSDEPKKRSKLRALATLLGGGKDEDELSHSRFGIELKKVSEDPSNNDNSNDTEALAAEYLPIRVSKRDIELAKEAAAREIQRQTDSIRAANDALHSMNIPIPALVYTPSAAESTDFPSPSDEQPLSAQPQERESAPAVSIAARALAMVCAEDDAAAAADALAAAAAGAVVASGSSALAQPLTVTTTNNSNNNNNSNSGGDASRKKQEEATARKLAARKRQQQRDDEAQRVKPILKRYDEESGFILYDNLPTGEVRYNSEAEIVLFKIFTKFVCKNRRRLILNAEAVRPQFAAFLRAVMSQPLGHTAQLYFGEKPRKDLSQEEKDALADLIRASSTEVVALTSDIWDEKLTAPPWLILFGLAYGFANLVALITTIVPAMAASNSDGFTIYSAVMFMFVNTASSVANLNNALMRRVFFGEFDVFDPLVVGALLLNAAPLITHIIPAAVIFPWFPVGVVVVCTLIYRYGVVPLRTRLEQRAVANGREATNLVINAAWRNTVVFIATVCMQTMYNYMLLFYEWKGGKMPQLDGGYWSIPAYEFESRSVWCTLVSAAESVGDTMTSWQLLSSVWI